MMMMICNDLTCVEKLQEADIKIKNNMIKERDWVLTGGACDGRLVTLVVIGLSAL